MGGIGLPENLSSMLRFVRASFIKLNSLSGDDEVESISQFFKILDSVAQQKGLCLVGESNEYEFTIYGSCVNTTKGYIVIRPMKTVKYSHYSYLRKIFDCLT